MAISKNNPKMRDHQRLVIFCPDCEGEMSLVKRVPGGMHYVCAKDGNAIPVSRRSYLDMNHQWVRK